MDSRVEKVPQNDVHGRPIRRLSIGQAHFHSSVVKIYGVYAGNLHKRARSQLNGISGNELSALSEVADEKRKNAGNLTSLIAKLCAWFGL